MVEERERKIDIETWEPSTGEAKMIPFQMHFASELKIEILEKYRIRNEQRKKN